MTIVRKAVKQIPYAKAVYHKLLVGKRELMWQLDPRAVASRKRLLSLKDSHRGERCFIIGNGPSLKSMDLSVLRPETTFGLNRIYLLFPELGFETTYFVSINPTVIRQFADDIADLSMTKFISWNARQYVPTASDTILLRSIHGPQFSTQPEHGIWEGATVTYVTMQLAYYLGFETVYLIGVDHNFSTKGPAHRLVRADADDPNHFHPNYFGKGVEWNLPDLETSELAYRLARKAFEEDGRQIFDATVGGKLTVFPKVEYEALF